MGTVRSNHIGFLTRMFLRDCAFLMYLYGRADSRRIWSYAVFSLAAPLAALALLAFFTIATFFPAAFPAALHPATAPKEILYVECGAICLAVGMSVEHRFRGLRDEVASLAAPYWRPMDRVKWCLMTLLGIGSIAAMGVLAVGWYR
jgi:hypothetical protein